MEINPFNSMRKQGSSVATVGSKVSLFDIDALVRQTTDYRGRLSEWVRVGPLKYFRTRCSKNMLNPPDLP